MLMFSIVDAFACLIIATPTLFSFDADTRFDDDVAAHFAVIAALMPDDVHAFFAHVRCARPMIFDYVLMMFYAADYAQRFFFFRCLPYATMSPPLFDMLLC